MKALHILPFLIFFNPSSTISQDQTTQTVRGKVVDKTLGDPIIGANVLWLGDSLTLLGAASDLEGNFRIDGIPTGRQSFRISSIQYRDIILSNIEVTSSKEVILTIALEEDTQTLTEVVIFGTEAGEADNDFAMVSARSFSVEETNRYAGSRGDPSRMASNFAGVQGADDSRNDLVIRGNSPLGVVYQVEGIPVPNLNHFAIPGSSGGPVSLLNNKTLSNSSFYTGAFPAQYGNALAGVFDLNLREGNDESHEFSGQLGFLGTELFGEGPIAKGKRSYLVSYRYSTLDLFNGLGIQIGTDALPKYQDMAFNVKLLGNDKIKLNLFGLGGTSSITINVTGKDFSNIIENEGTYSEIDRDQKFETSMGMTGLRIKGSLGKNTPAFAAVSVAASRQGAVHYLAEVDSIGQYVLSDPDRPFIDYEFTTSTLSATFNVLHKLNNNSLINVGMLSETNIYTLDDRILTVWDKNLPAYGSYTTRWDSDERATLIQGFIQYKSALSEKMDVSMGIHSQYFTLNQSISLFEPRLSLNYTLSPTRKLSLGFGKHSQTQPGYTYFYQGDTGEPYNKDLTFSRSTHLVAGYETRASTDLRIKAEGYYQWLNHIPIYDALTSSYSLANSGSGFSRLFPEKMENKGEGRNLGLEITVEKFFSKQFYFLITSSLYDSKYTGGDGKWRNTEFNGNYIFNMLGGKEVAVNERQTFFFGAKFTIAGGRRYGPVDFTLSQQLREIVYEDVERNSKQFKGYLRADLNANYKFNRPRVTHELGIDLVNVTNRQNLLKLTYVPPVGGNINPQGEAREEAQLGFLPIFFYKLSF